MRIGIEINGVLRDTLKKVQQEYEKWYLNENLKELKLIQDDPSIERKVISDVTSLELTKHLSFKDEDELYSFLYEESRDNLLPQSKIFLFLCGVYRANSGCTECISALGFKRCIHFCV